jgi:hypothetical protein
MRNKVDFPLPFNPIIPILAPRKNDRLISLITVLFGGYVLLTLYIEKIICLSSDILFSLKFLVSGY